jgi:hypothetical protein
MYACSLGTNKISKANTHGTHTLASYPCPLPAVRCCHKYAPLACTRLLLLWTLLAAPRCLSLPVAHRFLSFMFVLASWCRCHARVLPMPPCLLHLVLGGGRHAHGTRPPFLAALSSLSLAHCPTVRACRSHAAGSCRSLARAAVARTHGQSLPLVSAQDMPIRGCSVEAGAAQLAHTGPRATATAAAAARLPSPPSKPRHLEDEMRDVCSLVPRFSALAAS